jgi:hypothetical protein
MMEPMKPKRGGKRVGAGRPATVGATHRATVTLDQSTLDILKAISSNLSEAIRILARQLKD